MTPLRQSLVPERPGSAPREAVAPGLAAIQARFLELICDRVLVFETLKKDLEANRKPALALTRIADLAHKIAGVAATLGFPHAGELAADVERAVRDGAAAGMPALQTWERVSPTLEQFLDELESLLDD
ncbi:Hpt domain-containing protein [Tabrizicola oligotrophica]|uniref:Hpt domain-containing protein n=1 Tax=Tabrizicola oligotrophica TaxID=2710650 RepID=A0A6M0QZW4_9RHOB|nr:Hpt domain-containing protein [Tabrizicola oligotrophica]NEY92142.1 Hpt domain-containing protein [Tabrizicola oligotrophica]